MAISPFKLDRSIKVTSQLDGAFGKCGPGGSSKQVGAWLLHFVPDASFAGALAIVGRSAEEQAATNNVPYVPIPYKAVYLNTAEPATPYALTPGSTTIVSTSIILVPANFDVAVLFACSAGFGWLYLSNLNGSSAV